MCTVQRGIDDGCEYCIELNEVERMCEAFFNAFDSGNCKNRRHHHHHRFVLFFLRFGEDNAVRCCVGTKVEQGGARDRLTWRRIDLST